MMALKELNRLSNSFYVTSFYARLLSLAETGDLYLQTKHLTKCKNRYKLRALSGSVVLKRSLIVNS